MSRFVDITNQKYGKITALKRIGSKGKRALWLCQCECGNFIERTSDTLRTGNTKSCGCLQPVIASQTNTKHGLSRKRIYVIWKGMKRRCNNPKAQYYCYYGARGISVCEEWSNKDNGFVNFYNWSMKNGYLEELSIDRKDTNGNYEPNNCRWSTNTEQANNTRRVIHIEIDGETKTIAEWSAVSGITMSTIRLRYHAGDAGISLLRPLHARAKSYERRC